MTWSMRFIVLVLLGSVGTAAAQVVTGRSTAGSLSLAVADSLREGGTKPAKGLALDLEFSEPSGNKYLDPRETGRLRVVISNNGKTIARNVIARILPLAPLQGVTYNDSIVVGDIPANATRYAIFYFAASDTVPAQIVTVHVDVFANKAEATEPRLLTFLTRGADQRGE